MAIFQQTTYGVECDQCKTVFEHPFSGDSLWIEKDSPMEYARNFSWIEHDGKHYCTECYEYNMNEEIIIKEDE